MPQCPKCKGCNCFRLNPLEKTPQWRCLKCKKFFIEQKDRIQLLIVINQDLQQLKDIDDDGVINGRLFEFWRRTNPTFDKYAALMLEETPNMLSMLTPASTIEKDGRRKTDGNEDGLNATYREEKKKVQSYLEVG